MVSVSLQLQQSEQEASRLGAKVTEVEQREEAAVKERDEIITTLQTKVGHTHGHTYTCTYEQSHCIAHYKKEEGKERVLKLHCYRKKQEDVVSIA